jgi:hypothetical protein
VEKEEQSINTTLDRKACSELSYRITVPKGIFDTSALAKRVGKTEPSGAWSSIRRRSTDGKYHMHIYWRDEADDDDVDASKSKLQVDVHMWESGWSEENREPNADNFFAWVAEFFTVARVTAHTHAELAFSGKRWQSKIMTLPIEVPYAGKTASVHGVSVALHSEPEGIGQLWLDTGKNDLTLQLYGDRLLEFKEFDLWRDIDAFLSVAKSVIEEKRL